MRDQAFLVFESFWVLAVTIFSREVPFLAFLNVFVSFCKTLAHNIRGDFHFNSAVFELTLVNNRSRLISRHVPRKLEVASGSCNRNRSCLFIATDLSSSQSDIRYKDVASSKFFITVEAVKHGEKYPHENQEESSRVSRDSATSEHSSSPAMTDSEHDESYEREDQEHNDSESHVRGLVLSNKVSLSTLVPVVDGSNCPWKAESNEDVGSVCPQDVSNSSVSVFLFGIASGGVTGE